MCENSYNSFVLRLLGRATYLDEPVSLERSLALVALLACRAQWVSRDELANILWQDGDEATLKQRLRQLMYRAKQFSFGAGIESDHQRLRYLAPSDILVFQQAIGNRDWQTAFNTYQGELLAGANFDSSDLEEWFALERATFCANFRQATLEITANQTDAEAVLQLEQALIREPLSEELLEALLHRANTNPEVGKRAYERFERELLQRLQLEPPEELRQLYEALDQTITPMLRSHTTTKLPLAKQVFIGRTAEMDTITERCQDKNCRLLTLVGVGGIGKTSLALEIATRQQNVFTDGAVFVDLARLEQSNLVPNAILEAIGERATDHALDRVLSILASKNMLLLLDNFEHVISARDVVTAILEHCPNMRLLVTSREALGLRAEQIIELQGLPAPDQIFPLQSQDAAQIFLRAAQRSSLEFRFSDDDLPVFTRIFQAVSGIPLGLELAASWIRTLPLSEIADELEQSLDLLAIDAPDVPNRHRSFAAVFHSSWQLLNATEQTVLANLSVFRGGFDKDMAIQVANANLPLLLRLVNKSLVTRQEQRFYLHEMIRQYSQQYLETTTREQTLTQLTQFMTQLSEQWFIHQKDEQQTQWSKRLEQELDNIRTTLAWSVNHNHTRGAQLVGYLEHFWYSRGYHREGLTWAQQFLPRYTTPDQIRLHLIWTQTSLAKELSEYDLARASATEYQKLAIQLGDQKAVASSEKFFGLLAREQGNLEVGKQHLETAKTMFENLNDINGLAICWNDLGIVYAMQNDANTAKAMFEESLRLKRQVNDKQGIAYAIGNLGVLAGQAGDYALEQTLQLESLRLKRELGDAQGIANGLHELGKNAFDQNNLSEAIEYFTEALEIFCRLGRKFSILKLLNQISDIPEHLGDYEATLQIVSASAQLSAALQIKPSENWAEHIRQIQNKSGFAPAKLAELEFAGQRLNFEQAIAFAFTVLQKAQLEPEKTMV